MGKMAEIEAEAVLSGLGKLAIAVYQVLQKCEGLELNKNNILVI